MSPHGVAGVTIDFIAPTGALSGTRQVTSAAGVATLGGWTPPTAAGSGSGMSFVPQLVRP